MYTAPYMVLMRLHRAALEARRRSRTWHYLAYSVAAGLLAGTMIAIGALMVATFWAIGAWWLALPIGVVMVLPIVLPIATRHALVPLGLVRVTYWAARFSRPGQDAAAYGACAAAWAFAHAPTGASETWLAQQREARIPLGDAEVVVTALIAAGKGDAETCRLLLRSVTMLVEDHPAVRELAGEWLAVDAAERGAWAELHALADAHRWPATPLGFFLEGIAARRLGAEGAPGRYELLARWLLAPHRHATIALFDEAMASPPAPTGVDLDRDPEPEPLPRAVIAHLRFGHGEPTAARLAETVHAWDAALADGATHSWLARRALELDAPLGAVDRALREIAGAVTEELARAADRGRLGAPASHGPVGDALARKLRHGRLDALEAGFTRWAQRRHDGATRAAIDEWREFVALQAAYRDAAAAGGLELRRLAFPHAFSTGSNMAAWLWNTRHEYALSHAISKWLLAEALLVGDTEAIELGHRNCRLDVMTRLGAIPGDVGN